MIHTEMDLSNLFQNYIKFTLIDIYVKNDIFPFKAI